MGFSKARTQKAVDNSRKTASKLRKEAAKSTGPKRASLLKDAADYDREANRLVRLYSSEGVK